MAWDEFLDSLAVSSRVVEQQSCSYGYLQPNVTLSGNTSFCSGSSSSLTATFNNAYSYSWYQNSQVLGATNNVINSGHLLIHNLAPTLSSNVLGRSTYSQVDLEMYKYDGTNDDGAFDNESAEKPNPSPSTFGKTLRNPEGWNYLTGFASPFEELGSDYMFYHALAKPNKFSITSNKGPIVDPFFRMKKGEAYFMSMEVSHADHKDHIAQAIVDICKSSQPDVLLASGGTGPGPRDVTPEVLASISDRMLEGLGDILRTESLHYTDTAWLSRMTAGMVGATLVIALPGSPKAVRECWEVLSPFLSDALEKIKKQGFEVKR